MKRKTLLTFLTFSTVLIIFSCKKLDNSGASDSADQEKVTKEMADLLKKIPKTVNLNLSKSIIEELYPDGRTVVVTNTISARKIEKKTTLSSSDSVINKISFSIPINLQESSHSSKTAAAVSSSEETHPGAGETTSIAHCGFSYSQSSSGYITSVYAPWVTLDPNEYWTTQNGVDYHVNTDVSGVVFDPYPSLPALHPAVIIAFNVTYFFYRDGNTYTGSTQSTYYAHVTM